MLACYIPTLLSVVALPFWPLYVDTGIEAVYARKTSISNRINSGNLLHQVLPWKPTNVSGVPIEPAVHALVGDGTAGSSDSSTVFGDQVHMPHTLRMRRFKGFPYHVCIWRNLQA